ncbi:MAG: tRNA-dihydrouridine synthase, partial [Nocardioidaceae bacterium]|nr:tRNA-dihydrouridine synthase [Nocardioidaceae bacterium]
AYTAPPWEGGRYVDEHDGGWRDTSAPSPLGFAELPVPNALSRAEIADIVTAFAQAAERAIEAGFDVIELHAAHGYLLHSFLSPLSNQRTDDYGGGFDNRVRMLLETTEAVRGVWPESKPLFVRVSATDWTEGGWDGDQTVELARRLRARGVDLLDCSSGGAVPGVHIPTGPGYQVQFAARVRREAALPAAAVGLITDPRQAEAIIARGDADAVMLARAFLRDPHWAQRAGHVLGAKVRWPSQYQRAAWSDA